MNTDVILTDNDLEKNYKRVFTAIKGSCRFEIKHINVKKDLRDFEHHLLFIVGQFVLDLAFDGENLR